MITRAVLRYIRISPRKVRPVFPLIKGKKPDEAIAILFSVKKKASQYLIELLRSAMANARRMQGVDVDNLYISSLVANGGPQMKRFRAASMGRAGTIRKRTSHITIELDNLAAKAPELKGAAHAPEAHAAHAKTKAGSKVKKAETATTVSKKSKTKDPVKPESGKKGKE
jgi:large subunit ribosomal protein L22